MVLIGIVGKKYSGKDTAADYLVANHNFTKMAFADPVKKVAKELFNFNDEQLYGNLKEATDERWGISPQRSFPENWNRFRTIWNLYIFPQYEKYWSEIVG